ncbi:unnamed protein product [Linum tenue]|uniref:Uncharacterized protein n=1 Tax=Linum tenue TaxID=586396 RepID=A0AAV0L7G6_9ROSI|nr:unnamed protein product [Linum tenue]
MLSLIIKRRDLRLHVVDVADEVHHPLRLLLVVGDLRPLEVVVVRVPQPLLLRIGVVVDVQGVGLFSLLNHRHRHQLHRLPPMPVVEVHLLLSLLQQKRLIRLQIKLL